MDQHPETWTAEGVKGGLIGFYREIAGVGLVFPRADRPIAVEFPGYPVVRLRPIEGIEFVEEAVTALGYSTETRPPPVSGVCRERLHVGLRPDRAR
jgi:hypothetical protein